MPAVVATFVKPHFNQRAGRSFRSVSLFPLSLCCTACACPVSLSKYAAAVPFASEALRPPWEEVTRRRVLMNKIIVACGRAGPDHYQQVLILPRGRVRSASLALKHLKICGYGLLSFLYTLVPASSAIASSTAGVHPVNVLPAPPFSCLSRPTAVSAGSL